MSIDTTMYIHDTTMSLINNACALKGSKRNTMIIMLFGHAMKDLKRAIRTGCRVRYQDRDSRDKWHTIHVCFREDEADYVKDLRNFLKLSDSFILALAVRDYLNEIIRKSKNDERTDNYRFTNHVLSRDVVDGIILWRVYWGYTQKHMKNHPL